MASQQRTGTGRSAEFAQKNNNVPSAANDLVRLSDVNGGIAGVQIEVARMKQFFANAGLLPANEMFTYINTPPAFAGTPAGVIARENGCNRVTTGTALGYYDLGALKSKILIMIGGYQKISGAQPILLAGLASSAPAGVDPNNTYSLWNDSTGFSIYRKTGGGAGTYTGLTVGSTVGLTSASVLDASGAALYYDDATNQLKCYIRLGGDWFLVGETTDSNLTTFRYIYFQGAAANQRWRAPLICYAE